MGCNYNLNIWDMFSMNQVQRQQCHRMMVSGRGVASTIRHLINNRGLQLDSAIWSCMSHCS